MRMITIGQGSELDVQSLIAMHEFRREIFVRRLGWSLPLVGGNERDEYDRPETLYWLVRDALGNPTACARLLPTTGRYMLPELFPQLLGGREAPRDPAIWELSRFAVDLRNSGAGRVLSLSAPTLELLSSVLAYVGQRGGRRLLLVTSIGIERLMLRAGLEVHRWAAPAAVNGELCVALAIEVAASNTQVILH